MLSSEIEASTMALTTAVQSVQVLPEAIATKAEVKIRALMVGKWKSARWHVQSIYICVGRRSLLSVDYDMTHSTLFLQ